MKKFLLALAVLGTVSFATTSCNKDDDTKDADIVGTWEASDATVIVKTSSGTETTLEDFFKTLGIPAEAMEDTIEEEIPGRFEFTSDGKLIIKEKDDKGQWVNIGTGTYSLNGDQLNLNIKVEDDEEGIASQIASATVKKLTSSKMEIRLDMTPIMQALFAAFASEDEDDPASAAILKLFEGCSFYGDIAFNRV